MKILVAIPTYDQKIMTPAVNCLINETLQGAVDGDVVSVAFLNGCSHAAMGRNQLAADFMESDFDRLVFLDADVTFTPGSLLRVARHPFPFVGGAYRFKFEREDYPVGFMDDGVRVNRVGLIPVISLPGGFMSLSREVFERLKEAHPKRTISFSGRKMHCYFQFAHTDGTLFGEDSLFCKEWRELGEQVWLDPELELTHWDFNKPFKGHIGKWLKAKASAPAAEAAE